jgi:hypothetical protein
MNIELATHYLAYKYGSCVKSTSVYVCKNTSFSIQEKLTKTTQNVVVDNTRENVTFLIEHFDFFVKAQTIIIFFNEHPWTIRPCVHIKIAPQLAKSVWALYDNAQQ